ncbi:hypothetical protein GCM10025859_57550 [Alicyclobacillus fastidiosus]|nr:hypothetical protein GCM10025859_57550 [Alicyclobacillus fastidiosus]
MLSAAIGASANLDDISIGYASGHRAGWRSISFYLCTAFCSVGTCLVGGLSAAHIERSLSPLLCSYLGSGTLISIGIWTFFQAFTQQFRADATFDQLGFHEMMVVLLAQSVANLTAGFGAGFCHIGVWFTSAAAGLFTLWFLLAPLHGVRRQVSRMGHRFWMIAGVVLILVGLFR